MKSPILGLLVMLAVALSACGRDPVDTHVRLLVEYSGDSLSILSATRIPEPREGLQEDSHRLTHTTWRGAPVGSHELVFSGHGEDGGVLTSTSVHGHSVAIPERAQLDGTLSGGMVRPLHDHRVVDLYLPKETHHLAVHQTGVRSESNFHQTIAQGGGRTFGLDLLNVYPVKPDLPRPAALELPSHVQAGGPDSVTVRADVPHEATVEAQSTEVTNLYDLTLEDFLEKGRKIPNPEGEIEGFYFYPNEKAKPEEHYNIVIFADGFTRDELETGSFDDYARKLAEAFRTEPGLAEHQHLINFCIVATSSNASGIPDWNAAHESTSYFHSMKKIPFNDEALADPQDLSNNELDALATANTSGTLFPELVVNAGEAAGVPEHLADLYVLIANEPMNGMGIAWPNLYMAYVNVPEDDTAEHQQLFLNTGIHESSHVMGPLGDEYAYPPSTIALKDLGEEYPNLVRRIGEGYGSSAFGDVWWLDDVAEGDEINNGWFTNVQPCNVDDASQLTDSNETVGLFWPCVYWGCEYYRPSPMCKMQKVHDEFCRVCRIVLGEAITSVVPS